MNGLGFALAAIVTVIAAGLIGISFRPALRQARPFVWVATLILLCASTGTYAVLGRFGDWEHQTTDEQTDYLLAARITEARRQAKSQPENFMAHWQLAQAALEGERYSEAIEAVDRCIALEGPQAEFLGLKANALYYQDRRTITAATQKVIDEALRLDPMDLQTRLLIANHAYREKRYQDAIAQWQMLLEASRAPGRERALMNAIANAQNQLTLSGKN